MKDEIKTFAEYKVLAKECRENDSISRRKSIEDAIYNKARELLHGLVALYAKYDRDYVGDDDYREDRGVLSLTGFNINTVLLDYSDRWAYGGECDIGIEVPMKYLDDGEMAALEKELREEHMKYVKDQIQQNKAAIERLKKKVEELEAEYFQHQDKEDNQ